MRFSDLSFALNLIFPMILTSNLISRARFYLIDRPSVQAPALHLQAVQPSFSTDSKNISMQDATKQSSTSVFGEKMP
jgi:hypothetical protein